MKDIRQLIKRTIKTFFLLIIIPAYGLYHLLSMVFSRNHVFPSFSQALSLIPGKTGVYLRAAFYRLACPGTSDEISIGFLTVLSHWDTTIRPGVYIGPQGNIGKCFIGEKTLLGSGVHVLSGSKQHNFSDPEKPIQDQGGTLDKIVIGKDCWLGNGSIVMTNVPDFSIIAAGSVYTKECLPGDILAGNPAVKIKARKKHEKAKANENN